MLCHKRVFWSFCASLRAYRVLVHFVRVRSNSCSSMVSNGAVGVSGRVGGGRVVLPAGSRCAQALSCRAEFYRRLDGEVGSHVDHVGRC
jgi:hypothetical protein